MKGEGAQESQRVKEVYQLQPYNPEGKEAVRTEGGGDQFPIMEGGTVGTSKNWE